MDRYRASTFDANVTLCCAVDHHDDVNGDDARYRRTAPIDVELQHETLAHDWYRAHQKSGDDATPRGW